MLVVEIKEHSFDVKTALRFATLQAGICTNQPTNPLKNVYDLQEFFFAAQSMHDIFSSELTMHDFFSFLGRLQEFFSKSSNPPPPPLQKSNGSPLIFNIDRPLLTPPRGPRSCPNHTLCQTDQTLFTMAVAATSEIATREVEVAVIGCVALFYEEGKGGGKKNKFRCLGNKDEKRLTEFRENIR